MVAIKNLTLEKRLTITHQNGSTDEVKVGTILAVLGKNFPQGWYSSDTIEFLLKELGGLPREYWAPGHSKMSEFHNDAYHSGFVTRKLKPGKPKSNISNKYMYRIKPKIVEKYLPKPYSKNTIPASVKKWPRFYRDLYSTVSRHGSPPYPSGLLMQDFSNLLESYSQFTGLAHGEPSHQTVEVMLSNGRFREKMWIISRGSPNEYQERGGYILDSLIKARKSQKPTTKLK